ncbi:hypothetical protein [Nocardioides convexus]|uniref:hypothetical protein n=1 Tax=Nocardioides convexus TaxID=2712224 RepID=UPI0024189B37|nr:hypothetical protein [Nocardioides convexus]
MSTPLRPVAHHQRHVADLLARPGAWPTERVPLDEARGRVLAAAVRAAEQAAVLRQLRHGRLRRPGGRGGRSLRRAAGTAAGDGRRPGRCARRRPRSRHHRADHDRRAGPRGADAVVEVEVTDGGTETVAISAARDVGRLRAPRRWRRRGRRRGAVGRSRARRRPGWAFCPRSASARSRCAADRACSWSPPARRLAEEPEPGSGQIRDANGVLLSAAVEDAGAVAVRRLWVADDVGGFLARIDDESLRRGRGPGADLRRGERGRLRGGQGRARPARRGVRQGRHAAGDAAGLGAGLRGAGGLPAGQPGERADLVGGLRAPGPAGGVRAPAAVAPGGPRPAHRGAHRAARQAAVAPGPAGPRAR